MSNVVIAGNAIDERSTVERQGSTSKAVWIGRVITGLVVLFLLVDAVGHMVKADAYVEATVELGYSDDIVAWLGGILLVCTILYAIPRTAVLGAILLTGYLGGATATQVRLEESAVVFAVVLGVLVWAGLYLRNGRLRELISR